MAKKLTPENTNPPFAGASSLDASTPYQSGRFNINTDDSPTPPDLLV